VTYKTKSAALIPIMVMAFTAMTTLSHAEVGPATQGKVVLDCAWTDTVGVNDCHVVSETPSGLGLGEKAVVAMQGFKLVPGHMPKLHDGRFQLGVGVPLPQQQHPTAPRPT